MPAGDTRPRHLCEDCGTIFYQNPKIVAGCLAEWDDQVLLCRRGIQPRHGLWTLPAGYMENGETTEQAALRETLEEANARVRDLRLYSVFNLPHIDQVYLLYRGALADLDFSAGDESLEVRLFREGDIPWEELAFATIRETLRHYFADRRAGRYALHTGTITRSPAAS
jgi:ADP-ribose pyrophosphatase YjhB (NUDIX family)